MCKIIFGAEPKDYQVYQFLLTNWRCLIFSPPLTSAQVPTVTANPKRLQRLIQKQMRQQRTSTKAQQALGLQHQQQKALRQAVAKQQKEARSERQFYLRQQKKKEKRKGH